MIDLSEQKAFDSCRVNVFYKFVAEYRFFMKWQQDVQQVRIRIEEDPSGQFVFSQSHYIQTPLHRTPVVVPRAHDASAEGALQRATETIVPYFEEAVARGFAPSRGWFVLNEAY
ncbi:hypothetical protein [Chelatococcus reniformis]|uniref:Uncharacterized protein n=1 Tax=Chelatococcus reniformis TaxID=1494448 RepID=A0A916X9B6_9HYPH|nr:hypothetical protein [Chelatococcus reniformis]GGC53015.1 hypothetical protein GCM10010994_10150 [Chelatococcus reniformis]